MDEQENKLKGDIMDLAARINRYDAAAQLASLTAVWDDASVNVGVVVPWTRGGDKCSDRFGVRVARFQLLLGIDCATDFVCGYGYVMRGMTPTTAALATDWAKLEEEAGIIA